MINLHRGLLQMGQKITMRIRFVLLLCLAIQFPGCWPAIVYADPYAQMPRDPAPSAFLLVASQQMPDPRFRKTVLLVTRHGNTGPIGVILNRPQGITLDKIFPAYPASKELSLFDGGPAYPRQVSFLVRGADVMERTLTISTNVYLGFDLSQLGEMLSGKRRYTDLRVMHGVASWAPGQLEHEIQAGGWATMPVDEAVIFDRPPEEMWQELHDRAIRLQEF